MAKLKLAFLVLAALALMACSERNPLATPTPTPTPVPTATATAAAPATATATSAPAMTGTPVPAKPAAATTPGPRGPTDPPAPWKQVEEPGFAGGIRKTYNHDNARLPHTYLTWYFVALHADPNNPGKITTDLGQCSLRVTTDLAGERLSTLGAWRKFALEGNAVYTKEQLQELVKFWIEVLEKEPRGACAKPGAYIVSWQDATLASSNPQGRP